MTGFNPHDFPRPVVVAELSFEAEKGKLLQDEVSRLEANGLSTDTINIQADVLNIAAETAAARDVYFVARLNDAARVVLLSEFAEGADLDLKVKRSGLQRLPGETNEALRERERIEQKGKSSGGPTEYYIARALATDPRVRHVKGFGDTRNITERWLIFSVLTHDNNGIADHELLDRITASLRETGFKRNFVQVEAVAAVVTTINIATVIYYYPEAPFPEGTIGLNALYQEVNTPQTQPEAIALTALIKAYEDGTAGTDFEISQKAQGIKAAAKLRKQAVKDQRLGFDITDSYIKKHFHTAGAQRVIPQNWQDHFAAENQAFAIGNIIVTAERLLS